MSLRIKHILPILVLIGAIFLRFYRFEEFITFLGDQGRDAIIIKRIITFEHFPAIGPPSSIGQIYLGPFYYYLVSPFLLLFKSNPLGLALAVGFFSLLGIIASYFIVKQEFKITFALIFFVFGAFSKTLIQQSRFSWNPNLLPFFAFLTLYFFSQMLTRGAMIWAILVGAFLSFSIQLHHLAFLLFIPIIAGYLSFRIYFGISFKQILNRVQDDFVKILVSLFSFLLFSLPLVIFDLRHNFLNSRNLIKFLFEQSPAGSENVVARILETNTVFYSHLLQINVNKYLSLIFTLLIFIFLIKKVEIKRHLFLFINLVSFVSYLLLFSLFNTSRIAHYFNPVYLSFYLIVTFVLLNFSKKGVIRIVLVFLAITPYLYFNLKALDYLLAARGNNQIQIAEIIADSILNLSPKTPYQTVALPYVETDGHVRYFLEIKGSRPLPADTLANPRELYILCFEKDPDRPIGGCRVLGNPQWQIAAFYNAKIAKIWEVEGVIIYKLIHIDN